MLTDKEISDKVIIKPFCNTKTQHTGISYGLNPFGYDIRLSPNDFRVFTGDGEGVIDPKRFDPNCLQKLPLIEDSYFVLPAFSYALGVAYEYIEMPNNVSALCFGKSTYARSGVVLNLTPIEAGWRGYLTLEMANCSPKACRIYAYEGISQIVFFDGKQPPITTYGEGKYQNQQPEVTLARKSN